MNTPHVPNVSHSYGVDLVTIRGPTANLLRRPESVRVSVAERPVRREGNRPGANLVFALIGLLRIVVSSIVDPGRCCQTTEESVEVTPVMLSAAIRNPTLSPGTIPRFSSPAYYGRVYVQNDHVPAMPVGVAIRTGEDH